MQQKPSQPSPNKPRSIQTAGQKSEAWNEYQARQQATLENMARQRAARLSAFEAVKMKNRAE